MSERSDVMPVPEGEYVEANRFPGLSMLLAVVGLVSLGLCVVGANHRSAVDMGRPRRLRERALT